MAVVFHHVGSENSKRDFPATIGSPMSGLKRFGWSELETLSELVTEEVRPEYDAFLRSQKDAVFQIWGIPSGAARIFEKMQAGDLWMLLDSPVEGGGMQYVGKVDYKISGNQFALSKYLWTESRFPHVFFLHGKLIHFPWFEFLDLFGYRRTWDPRGHVCGVADERISGSEVKSAAGLLEFVSSRYGLRNIDDH